MQRGPAQVPKSSLNSDGSISDVGRAVEADRQLGQRHQSVGLVAVVVHVTDTQSLSDCTNWPDHRLRGFDGDAAGENLQVSWSDLESRTRIILTS
ncbi:hypothetical protein MES5069_420076 [Mesorhizobium escarrei]|uniref:Uncharacterized protein n=1 Tax=Mesorhizobium escarrei TaxID=666018 RepID=A0ABN8K2M1_9HYPH|nr:hypothetical protein MES5069_420076 [Mesorhizobium escarrei]